MPLHLSPLELEDIPAFAALDAAAMANWGVARAMQNGFPPGKSRQEVIEEWTSKDFGKDPEITWLKVTDTELNNQIISVAMWRFQLDEVQPREEKTKTKKPEEKEPAPAAEALADVVVEDAAGKDDAPGEGKKFPNVMAEMGVTMEEFRQKHLGTKPRATLQILVTDPKHQRRGAGGMLVQWGCEKADEHGIISVLAASDAGLGLYIKHGFHVVMESDLDLRPYGVDETEVRRYMIRQPFGNIRS